MSASQKSSRWGSFLSQAVAGVEARLDTILAEDDGSKASSTPAVVPNTSQAPPTPPTRSATPSKSANDRLQERLARAVASRNAASSARQSTEVASTTSSPRPSSDTPRPLPTSTIQAASPRPSLSVEEAAAPAAHAPTDASDIAPAPTVDSQLPVIPSPRSSMQLDSANAEIDNKQEPVRDNQSQPTIDDTVASSLYEDRITLLEQTLEEIQVQHQEELHSHIERVDALQTKLQYLAREASEHARTAATNASSGSLDKKIAEKDDQIAQLMLEGQKLASTEQKHRTIIKKLRAQLVANEKELNEQKIWRQKAEKELADLRRRVDESNDLEKTTEETRELLSQSKREIDRLKVECEEKDRSAADLKSQLLEESEKAKSLAARTDDHQREAGQKRVKELEDTVAALEVEKGLAVDRAKLQIAEAREKAERASERARAIELELKGEVQVLESKLEALRARAEEASSGAVGDAQVKLLRQIETLQTQYSVASENWQGMEASLEARAANLEKERDEALRRESEMRRKAREAASRAKRQEEDLEEMQRQLPTVQRDLKSYQSELDTLKKRAEQAEAALAESKAELAKHQASSRNDRERTDHDRPNWLDEVPVAAFRDRGRPESPLLAAPQRTFSGDNFLGLQNYPNRFRKTSAPSSNGEPSPSDRQSVRRPSVQPPVRSPLFPSLSSFPTATTPSVAGGFDFAASTPTRTMDRDDVLDGLERSASPQNVLQDMMSVSTMTAGPSVQIVERMSAAIRRLESEKIAAKEDLARISGQRDEARAEIVALIQELETNKSATKRVADLEREVDEINERYQTTLEMLGEKSELVEELRADVQDVKAMYRDLVERTIK
ncbi:TATA element modulatory factor 1 TATA binding-domain-containing protein [Xylaria flabelliformis]|nr:TATA element modulatory factor 1 TATA binding-domain-containing protein [Xylaria flabelliformis]